MSRHRTRHPQPCLRAIAKALPPSLASANLTNQPKAVPFNDLLNRLAPTNPYGRALAMPRDSADSVPFGPLNPLVPEPISPSRRDTGRPEPRIHQYEPGWNIPGIDRRPVPWHVLLNAADQVDVMRWCLQIRKRHVRSLKWCWNVSSEAVQAAYRADPRRGSDDIEAELRDRYWPDIGRLTAFWEKPWRTRGLNLSQWVNAVQEQQMVLDAVAIYPRMTYGGELFGLELVDGSTIKPLIDWRGDRPTPPMPAYQQELYGFPRGEYTATTEVDEDGNEVIHNAYGPDQLYYWQEVYRPRHMFGFSAVEQALFAARMYLKRQGWMFSEYDDGSTPLTWLVPEGASGSELDPRQRTEWERALNDDLAGQTAARHRIKLSYPGFKPEMMPSVDERYKPDYDLFLIKLLCAPMGVPMAELGFSEAKGLGTTGFHEGQEDVMDRVGRKPDIAILEEIINDISHTWLRAPAELQFTFLGLESEDEAAQDAVAQNRVQTARMTINEDRKRQGLPLFDFPEADMPMVMTQRGVIFLEGSSELAPPGEMVTPVQAPPETGPPEGENADPDDDTPGFGEQQQATKPGGKRAPKNAPATPKAPPGKAGQKAPPKRGPDRPSVKPAPGTKKGADPTKAMADSDSTRDRVRAQLADDFPPDAMDWLKSAVWSGPENVPISDIDFEDADTWAASHEDDKVQRFAGKIKAGKLKPVVLVNTPDERKYVVVDGHHRVLASKKLGIPVLAYIGRVAKKTGPWDQMHSLQRTGASAGDTAASKELAVVGAPEPLLPPLTDDAAREHAAYRNWARKARARGRLSHPFAFEHTTAPEAILRGWITFENVGVTATFKAVDAGPKAPASAKHWPGWTRDIQTADHYARQLTDTLTAKVNADAIAARWGKDKGLGKSVPGLGDALLWLGGSGIAATILGALRTFLSGLYAEGMAIGSRSAKATATVSTVDWGTWTPGDPEAARLILGADGLGSGLQQLLEQAGITIKSMGDGRMEDLAKVLANALQNGDSVGTLAKALRGVLADPKWAHMVATTELNRAVSAATLAQYQQMGLAGKVWMTADDGRVCAYCQENEDEGAIPLDASFASGDAAPPGHPRCRCALGPAVTTAADQ